MNDILPDDRPETATLERGLEALRSSPAFRGAVEPLDGHDSHDHLALIYESKREQFAAAIPFVQQGLERGERCMYVADENSVDEVLDAMRTAGVDVDEALDSGALTVHTRQETYRRNGSFDPDDMIEFLADAIDEATAEYGALRVTGEMTWILDDDTEIEDLTEYEGRLNRLFPGEDCLALCQYNRDRFPAAVIRDVVRTHPYLIYDDAVCHNVCYTPPEEFFGPDRPDREVDRIMQALRERTEAKVRLHDRQQSLQRQMEIIADPDRSFDAKGRALLDLGCERFGLDIGFLAEIDGDRFEVVEAIGSHEEIQPGRSGSLSEMYCRRTIESSEPMGITNAIAEGWEDDPAYERYELDAYLGTTVSFGDGRIGALCFASRTPRDEPFTDAEYTSVELMGHWVSYELERRHREAQLTGFDELCRALMNVETADEIADLAVDHLQDRLKFPLAVVARYDESTGRLSPVASTTAARDRLPTATLCEGADSVAWEAFVASEPRTLDDTATIPDDLAEIRVLPLDRHGVFVVATAAIGGFSDVERDLLETVASTVTAAFSRADRQQLLQERESRLEEQNRTLERLNRINGIIRNIDQALVGASTRAEIERVVCDELASTGPYELAWIGNRNPVTGDVVPSEWAGNENGYFDAIAEDDVDGTAHDCPVQRAIRTHELQVVADILKGPPLEPWREEALHRGYRSSISLPLVYDGSLYGVVCVYANRPNAFDDLERAVLAELSDTIAHAINGIESKKSLAGERVTELEFEVRDRNLAPVRLMKETGCTFTFEGFVPEADGQIRVFFATEGVSAETFMDHASYQPIRDVSVITERGDGDDCECLFEATVASESLVHTVLNHGGVVHEFYGTSDEMFVVVHLGSNRSVREFVEMFRTRYPDSTLVAQREREGSLTTWREFRSDVRDSLTERQLETLRMAYRSGFFETPRTRTGSEIAESLGITQPTFNTHIRAAQRKLFTHLFSDDPDPSAYLK